MNRLLKGFLLPLLGALMTPAMAQTDHAGVLVFTATYLPAITGVDRADRVFYLDGANEALKDLRFANPGSEAKAREKIATLLQTPRGQAVIEAVQRSGEGVAAAWQHGIEKLPAVLVGGNQVVYGVFDVDTALSLIEKGGRNGS